MREALSAHVLNGLSVAVGLLLVTAVMFALLGQGAAVGASVGCVVALIPDAVQPRRGKFMHLLVAPAIGVPLFLAVQLLRADPLELGLFLVPATFIAFLATAWGRRGMGVTIAIMFALLLALAPPPAPDTAGALLRTLWCGTGALLYVLYATAAGRVLNKRYRALVLADSLAGCAALLRGHALRAASGAEQPPDELARQAALAQQLEIARDLLLERPTCPRRQQLAGMLMVALEIRDRLIAGPLELEHLAADQPAALHCCATILHALANAVDGVAHGLRWNRPPTAMLAQDEVFAPLQAELLTALRHAQTSEDASSQIQAAALGSVATRLTDQHAAVAELVALARGECTPRLSAVRASWRLFVSPAYWSWHPLLRLWHWRAPALRHAIRAALAVGAGYALAHFIPWGSRDYWVLLTIVVVLRADLAQTLQRLRIAVAGTVVGSLAAALLIALEPPAALLLIVVVASQGLAHAYVVRRYAVTAVCGALLGLTLSHLLLAGVNPRFDFLERVGDALLGAALAWAFSFVLPNWERTHLNHLVERVCRALAHHAHQSLALAALGEVGGPPELAWRLARREAYDALAALVQTTGRAGAEPSAHRPSIPALRQLQTRGYQLLGQLSAVQSLLLLRREQYALEKVHATITATSARIGALLDLRHELPPPAHDLPTDDGIPLLAIPEALPEPLTADATPWLLRRLARALERAREVRMAALTLRAAPAGVPTAPQGPTASSHNGNTLPQAQPLPPRPPRGESGA